jgi:hypothetical protein
MRLSACDGVLNLLCTANDAKASDEYTFYLNGDLSQMAEQKSFLINRGMDVSQRNVYPVLKECDVLQALKILYEHKVKGWWNYRDRYIKHEICTKEEFQKALELQCSK